MMEYLGRDGSTSIYPPSDLNDLFQQAYNDGARIHSNSWGSSSSAEPQRLTPYWCPTHTDIYQRYGTGLGIGDIDNDGVMDICR
ncbi:MAG: hypothetical protein ACE5J9_10065 [Methanosarcinales archaeon]